MSYRVETIERFDRAVAKLDRGTALRILKALTSLAELDDPAGRCRPLTGPLAGLWRMRVGDYRVILDIRRTELVIIALDAGNRDTIYD